MNWTVRWRHPDGEYRVIGYYSPLNVEKEMPEIVAHWRSIKPGVVETYERVRPRDEESTSAQVAYATIQIGQDGQIYTHLSGDHVDDYPLPETSEPEDWS